MKVSRGTVFALLVALGGLVFWSALAANLIPASFKRDYISFYSGALIARTGHFADLYNYKAQVAVQDSVVPDLQVHHPWVRPAFYALLLAPISFFPVKTAFIVWLALEILGMFGAWIWAWRRFGPDSMVYCAFFLPAALGIAHGQDCIVTLLEFLAVWLLLERKRDTLAGLVLALTLFKFHLFLLLPLAILLRRRWKFLGGYAIGGSALAALSLALIGTQGVRDYIDLLTRKDLGAPSPELMIGLNSIGLNLGLDALWIRAILMAIPVGLVLWNTLRVSDEMRWFWTAVIGSMMMSPHTYGYDLALLLVPGLLAAYTVSDRALRITGALVLMPIPYFCSLLGPPWPIVPSVVVVAFLIAMSGILALIPSRSVQPSVVQAPAR